MSSSTAYRIGYLAGLTARTYAPVQPVREYARGFARGTVDRPKEAPMIVDTHFAAALTRDETFHVRYRNSGDIVVSVVDRDNNTSLILDMDVTQARQLRDKIDAQLAARLRTPA